jgi:hypothetical protein
MLSHMIEILFRYDTRPGRFRRESGRGPGTVMDARAAREPNPMDESRTMKMQTIRERLERDEYEVDPREVADAIVARLLSARSHATHERPRPTT